ILVALAPAKVVAEILADLRIGIADAVLVILRRNQGQRIGLVAVFLEIRIGDLAEDAGKAAFDVGLLAHVGALEQYLADLRSRRRGHLLDADHERNARRTGPDRLDALVHGSGTRRAGVLDPRRPLEAQIGRSLQYQRGGKILRREATVEMAEQDFIDVGG